MKQGIAIFLLGAFVYGTTLYPLQLWYRLYQQQEHTNLSVSNFGNDTTPSNHGKEVVFKIPLALPYHSDWEQPAEATGLFENDGEFYTIVSKNYKQDTIYITCLQNTNAREIFGLLSSLVKPANEEGEMQKNRPISVVTDFFKKDYQTCSTFSFAPPIWLHEYSSSTTFLYTNLYNFLPSGSLFRPPIS